MLIDFCFIGKKTDFGRSRRRKAAAFSFAKAGIDENIGLPGQQHAARCRSTVQLTEIRRQKVANDGTVGDNHKVAHLNGEQGRRDLVHCFDTRTASPTGYLQIRNDLTTDDAICPELATIGRW